MDSVVDVYAMIYFIDPCSQFIHVEATRETSCQGVVYGYLRQNTNRLDPSSRTLDGRWPDISTSANFNARNLHGVMSRLVSLCLVLASHFRDLIPGRPT